MKKRIIAIFLLTVVAASLFTACGKGRNELVGQWVAASEQFYYPDAITLKSDGSGSIDGLWSYFNGSMDGVSLTCYTDGNILTIITNEYGDRTYSYRISGNKLWLDDSCLFFKQ